MVGVVYTTIRAHLGEDKERHPKANWTMAVVVRGRAAHRQVNAALVHGVQQEWNSTNASDEAKRREKQVPRGKRAVDSQVTQALHQILL